MLRTVLLMDGSEAMNSSSDYLPSYLLAMRPPLLRLVERYLDSTPLASLGIVVMRDGVSHRLLPCTTNRNEIVDVLERDIFLHGGSGAMSLENGLRMAMSELVDMRKVAALAAAHTGSTGTKASGPGSSSAVRNARAAWKGSAMQLNVWVVSASVTLIDPTDVFSVVNTMAALSIRLHVVSLVGAVHVFDVCAVETGGVLYCPLNYDHLLSIVDDLATAHRAHAAMAAAARTRKREQQRRDKRTRTSTNGDHHNSNGGGVTGTDEREEEDEDVDAPHLIPIGCPVYLKAPITPSAADAAPSYYLACPQCHLIQLSVPTTCPMCRLLLCSAPMLYSTYVSHNTLVPSAKRLRVVRNVADAAPSLENAPSSSKKDATSFASEMPSPVKHERTVEEEEDAVVEVTMDAAPVRCALCMTRIPVEATRAAATTGGTTSASTSVDGARVWQCSSCASYRCDACNDFVMKTIGLCPHCVALR